MAECSIYNAKYAYLHDHKWPSQAIDMHHIAVRKSGSKGLLIFLALLLLANAFFYHFLVKEKLVANLVWSFLLGALLLLLLRSKSIVKESVVVMPAFGVQLETHYGSGRVARRFFPFGKILKPVLNECVTPVTCYWSLSLIVRDEEELTLVFKELRPPLKMLVPVWKALCGATNSIDSLDIAADCR